MGNSHSVGGRAPVHTFASSKSWIDGKALDQQDHVAGLAGVCAVAGMPDLHPGKYGPVGCAILADRVYPELAGSDIGCGMALYRLSSGVRGLSPDKLAGRLRVLDAPWEGDARARLAAAGLASSAFDAALGSIGGGNHFCEIQGIDEIFDEAAAQAAGLDRSAAYVLVHSGSRGLGRHILEMHLGAGGGPLAAGGTAARDYLTQHDAAVTWACLNRRIIAERAADAARGELLLINDVGHNLVEAYPYSGAAGQMPSAPFLHRKGAACADRGLVPIPGSRGTLSYLVAPLAPEGGASLASLAHGAGRKHDRASMHGRVATKKSDLAKLTRNPFGGFVVCEDRDLLVEEAPEAYKAIDRVIEALETHGLARVVASFKPLVTFKTARNRREISEHRWRAKREARR